MVQPSWFFSVAHSGLCLVLLGALSIVSGEVLLIPAVGASAYLVFTAPGAEVSAPRNVLIGHAVGALLGLAMLQLFGLQTAAGGLLQPLAWSRVGAVAASLAATVGVLRILDCPHPPAGATTMIVSVGLLPRMSHVLHFFMGATVVVVYATLVYRPAGIAYPLWARAKRASG